MADTSHHIMKKKKRNYRFNPNKKFTLGDFVEVRSFEDGFQGSWHPGKVTVCGIGSRVVTYEHLLKDDGDFVTEDIGVSRAIDGIVKKLESVKRGRIRPPPPVTELVVDDLYYGLCVDSYIDDAWWEGVVFDHDVSNCREVFFPELGDVANVKLENLRITQDWNEITGEWTPRGKWLFLELVEKYELESMIPVSTRQIWYDMREMEEFRELEDWCFPEDIPLWKKSILKVIDEYLMLTAQQFLTAFGLSKAKLIPEAISVSVHDVVLPIDNDLQDDDVMMENETKVRVDPESNESTFSEEPMALSIIPSSPNRSLVVKFKLSKNSRRRRKSRESKYDWTPFEDDEPEYCPEAVDDYYNTENPTPALTKRFRQHLLYSRWRMEAATMAGKSHQVRCISPEGKVFYSLREVVLFLCEGDTSSDMKRVWKSFFGSKNDLKPEFCPESVDDYINSGKPPLDLTKKFRRHVLYLGWKMESTLCGRQLRVRYISPKGKVCYNPREVLLALSERDNSSDVVEDSRRLMVSHPIHLKSREEKSSHSMDDVQNAVVRSPDNVLLFRKSKGEEEGGCYDLLIASKYCPEAIFKYLESFESHRTFNSSSELADNARMHLAALGWKTWSQIIKGKREEWRYTPPNPRKTYHSLKAACGAIKKGKETNMKDLSISNAQEEVQCREGHEDWLRDRKPLSEKSCFIKKHRAVEIRKQKRKWKRHSLSLPSQIKNERRDLGVVDKLNNERRLTLSSFMSKKRKALNKVKSLPDGHKSTRVMRSSKRVRQIGPTSSSQLPRTVLSWMIEKNAVVPRSKVYYYNENSSKPLAEGRIARDGIRCNCCQKLFTLSSFQAHATGNNTYRPAENIFLENGKSLVSCQAELMCQKMKSFSRAPVERSKVARTESWNDHICSICHYGGELILCDQCPSSFHAKCLDLPDVPEGDWFCPSCCCGVCGKSQFNVNTEQLTDDSALCCHQCERRYHARCKRDRVLNPGENWFCCKTCEKMHWGLQQLLGKPILVGVDNLTWTLVKPMHYQAEDNEDCDLVAMAENYSKLSVALEVMHECFEPVKEPRTRRDLVEDVLFCRGSNLNRLNFKGFYTVLLERNDELITVATLRVYGDKVAEIPLIGTRFQHRRLGMCRVLMNEIEKNLMNLGVQKLVLPAASSVLNTWTTSFGFSIITESDRSELLGYTFLDFQDTVLCQKLLRKLPLPCLSRDMPGVRHQPRRIIERSNSILDHEGNSSMSEVFQEDRHQGSETVDQGAQINGPEDKPNGTNNNPDAPSAMVTAIVSSNQEGEQKCNTLELVGRKRLEREKSEGNLQYYKRKKVKEPRPPAPQNGFSKLEVSCR